MLMLCCPPMCSLLLHQQHNHRLPAVRMRGPPPGATATAAAATAARAPSPAQQSEVLVAIGGLAAQMAEMRSLQTAQRSELAEIRAAVAALRG